VGVWEQAAGKRVGRLNACPTIVRKLLILHGGAGGFACESVLTTPFPSLLGCKPKNLFSVTALSRLFWPWREPVSHTQR
jgi:hypothetical protein